MHDFELHGGNDEDGRLSIVDTEAKAQALLRLLDSTIGTHEGAVVPYDLANALEHVRDVAPKLTKERRFRRLATLARQS